MGLFDLFSRKGKVDDWGGHYCDGCGEEYPRTHLVYIYLWDGKFCDKCSIMEDDPNE